MRTKVSNNCSILPTFGLFFKDNVTKTEGNTFKHVISELKVWKKQQN